MRVEIKKIDLAKEVDRLIEIEAQIFSASDALQEHDFDETECYWLIVDGVIAGFTSLRHNFVWSRKIIERKRRGCLYIVSTGILPKFQERGLGKLLKAWQVAYAKINGFKRLTTTCRASNVRIMKLNEKFGFEASGEIPNCYHDPEEAAVIMELRIQ